MILFNLFVSIVLDNFACENMEQQVKDRKAARIKKGSYLFSLILSD